MVNDIEINTPFVADDAGLASLVERFLRRPALWPAFLLYCYGYLRPRLGARSIIARGGVPEWNRDETTRA